MTSLGRSWASSPILSTCSRHSTATSTWESHRLERSRADSRRRRGTWVADVVADSRRRRDRSSSIDRDALATSRVDPACEWDHRFCWSTRWVDSPTTWLSGIVGKIDLNRKKCGESPVYSCVCVSILMFSIEKLILFQILRFIFVYWMFYMLFATFTVIIF